MKKIILSLLTVCFAVSFTSCSKEDEELNMNIIPHETTEGQLNLYADETLGTFSFYAPDAWSLGIGEKNNAERLSWLTPAEISGIAGDVELAFSLSPNISGKERSTRITVFCGNTAQTFGITQYHIKKNGEDGYIPFPEFLADDEKPATVEPTGFFVANEDWFGHRQGSISRFHMDGTYSYPAYANANPGLTLGVTTQFAMSWGDCIYMISKQEPRLVVAEAATLKMKTALASLEGADGRGACGVDANTIYISTSSGILIFDVNQQKITGAVTGIEDSGDLYNGQVGDMVRSGDYVFAAVQGKGIAVVDCASGRFVKMLGNRENSGVCVSRDGYVWAAGNPILKIDPYALEVVQKLQLPASCSGGQADWAAWKPTSLCAGTQSNCIYWSESGYGFCRYDIDGDVVTTNLFPASVYGIGRIEPVHDYYTKIDGTSTECTASLYTLSGQRVYSRAIEAQYIFPSHPFYEDANAPVILSNQIYIEPDGERKICLSDMVYDADDAAKQILKTLSFRDTDDRLVSCEVKQDTLYLRAGAVEGYTAFDMHICSHGKQAAKSNIHIVVKKEE